MTAKNVSRPPKYTPEELKILVDALNGAPSYLSKRFILKYLCGWSDELVEENMKLKMQEEQQKKIGDIQWR
jgi:hypothetical protein